MLDLWLHLSYNEFTKTGLDKGGLHMSDAEKMPMPKTRDDFDRSLMTAFIAGCHHGYTIVCSQNMSEQERLGAAFWIGRISKEEFDRRLAEICKG